jgi:hypothetical protein
MYPNHDLEKAERACERACVRAGRERVWVRNEKRPADWVGLRCGLRCVGVGVVLWWWNEGGPRGG